MSETITIPLPAGIAEDGLGVEDIIEFSVSYIRALQLLSGGCDDQFLNLDQDAFDALLRPLTTRLEAIRALHKGEVGELARELRETRARHDALAEQGDGRLKALHAQTDRLERTCASLTVQLREEHAGRAATAEQSAEYQQKLRDALAGYEALRTRLDSAYAEIRRLEGVEASLRNHLARIAPPAACVDGGAG